MRFRGLYTLLLFTLFSAIALAAQEKQFYLHDGDTVVFYGDSITEQGFYTAIVDLYVHTRFPQMKVKFYSAGIGGDRVTGGFAGPVDERLQRDVFAHHPTVVTVMLGMNDGGYKAIDDATIASYTGGYEHILDSIRQTLPHARITLLGTSPYDEATRPALIAGGYNANLQKLLSVDQMLAKKYDAVYVDLNAPVFAALQRGDSANHLAAEMLIPDRIHPTLPLHWIMAAALLRGWNAPALVTAVTMDGGALRIVSSKNAMVSGLVKAADGVSWQETDRALPLPLDNKIADINFMLQNSDVEQNLNQQTLRVFNLPVGRYRLRIDDGVITEVSAEQLKSGLNLAEYATPMRGQAQGAMWLIRDYEYTQLVHTRLLVRDEDKHISTASGDAEFTKFEELQQGLIDDAVQPKPHMFRLELIQ